MLYPTALVVLVLGTCLFLPVTLANPAKGSNEHCIEFAQNFATRGKSFIRTIGIFEDRIYIVTENLNLYKVSASKSLVDHRLFLGGVTPDRLEDIFGKLYRKFKLDADLSNSSMIAVQLGGKVTLMSGNYDGTLDKFAPILLTLHDKALISFNDFNIASSVKNVSSFIVSSDDNTVYCVDGASIFKCTFGDKLFKSGPNMQLCNSTTNGRNLTDEPNHTCNSSNFNFGNAFPLTGFTSGKDLYIFGTKMVYIFELSSNTSFTLVSNIPYSDFVSCKSASARNTARTVATSQWKTFLSVPLPFIILGIVSIVALIFLIFICKCLCGYIRKRFRSNILYVSQ